MLRAAIAGSRAILQQGHASAAFSTSTRALQASEGGQVAQMIKDVGATPSAAALMANLKNLKSAAQPVIPQPPPAKGLSPLTLWIMAGFGLSGYVGYTKAATSKEWMPDVMLGVLFGAWFFTWPALLPIRQLPKVASQLHAHTSQPLQGFRSMLGLK